MPAGAAQAVQALRKAGVFIDTATNRHDGEGTTSMPAVFQNTYLELLWVDSTLTVDSAHQADAADLRGVLSQVWWHWAEPGVLVPGHGRISRCGSTCGGVTWPLRARVEPICLSWSVARMTSAGRSLGFLTGRLGVEWQPRGLRVPAHAAHSVGGQRLELQARGTAPTGILTHLERLPRYGHSGRIPCRLRG